MSNHLKLLLILLAVSGIYPAFAQKPAVSVEAQIALQEALQHNSKTPFAIPRQNAVSEASGKYSVNPAIGNLHLPSRVVSASCMDSSYLKRLQATGISHSFQYSVKTSDGGLILGGLSRNKNEPPLFPFRPHLIKLDSLGNFLWSKQIIASQSDAAYVESIDELSDGSLIITGSRNTSDPNGHTFITKLTSSGDLIWFKTFTTPFSNNCTGTGIRYISVAEGPDGGLLLTATVWNCPLPKLLLVFKLSADGDMLWNNSFRGWMGDSYAVGIFYDGGNVTVVNRESHYASGGDNVIHTDFLKLNYSTGDFISQKAWKMDMPTTPAFYYSFTNGPKVIKLSNGNYCVYGQLFGDFITGVNQPRFSVLEFNPAYDFVKGYTIISSLQSNFYADGIEVSPEGRAIFVLTEPKTYPDEDKFIALAEDGFIQNQRKKEYRNYEVFYDNLQPFADGSYAFITNLSTIGQSEFYLDYSLLHASDTGSICLGGKSNFASTINANYVPYSFNWTSITPDTLTPISNQGVSISSTNFAASPVCNQKSLCDTIDIRGTTASCSVQQAFTFTAHKNKACGSRIRWGINPAIVQSVTDVNDTTVQVTFNQPWQGWVYAMVTSSCGLLRDSLLVSVFPSPGAVNLGPDTSICPGNTVLLNARRGYASYLWNDNSTDSTLTVTNPGKYFVVAKDACGATFSDTIEVLPAPPVPFSIGADRTKCNNDTLHLNAAPGFLNYAWGPAYNINVQTGQQVIVQPLVDTIYYARAEKTPGCFGYDTLRVFVKVSPPVDLGADKSICTGDSLTLNAGAGFVNYSWSNGAATQQTIIKTAGTYSVIATTADGCRSYDTFRLQSTWPLPQVTLNDNPALCTGAARILQAGSFSSYLWHDGSTAASYVVRDVGVYHVTVTDNNQCKGSDTVRITQLLPLPAGFLPTDTSVCNNRSITIQPKGTFNTYLWSNNSSLSYLSVSAAGKYWLEVTDASGCRGKDTVDVQPKECLKGFYMPNAFSPNNNRSNEFFKPIVGGVIKQYRLLVYNRWGQLVFTSNDILRGWDGTLNGRPQDANIYAWVCTYQMDDQPLKTEKGTVILVR